MKLTVKNIGRSLLGDSTVNQCPMCGDEAQICAYKNKDGQQVKIFCESCGSEMDFVEYLVDLEKREIIPCTNAEKTSEGKCRGYQKSEQDDEPAERCKGCKQNIFYEE